MLDHFKYLFILLICSFLLFISCVSTQSLTVEEFENSLIEQGYKQCLDSKTNSYKEIRALIDEKKFVPLSGTSIKKDYLNFEVKYYYTFIGLSDEMINSYVWLSFSDKDGNLKEYEIKNLNNEKGFMSKTDEILTDDYYEIRIENPTYYYWDKSCEVEATDKSLTIEEFENSLLKQGYEEYEIGNSKAGNELLIEMFGKTDNINVLNDKLKTSSFTLYCPKEKYQNFTVEKKYLFIGFENKMINRYVTIMIWGYDKNNEYVCKGFEKKNINNKKGKRYKSHKTLKDIDGRIITNPILYLWE